MPRRRTLPSPSLTVAPSVIDGGAALKASAICDFLSATLTLDLVDREGKFENGFCRSPELAFFDGDCWHPARINFTANAVIGQVGAGRDALYTLFHEGGHAAHFANIQKEAPCFSQESSLLSTSTGRT